MDPKQLEQEYSKRRAVHERIADEAAHTLENGLKQYQIKFHSVTKRIKEFSSFASKAVRRQAENPFEDITDTVGLRVVCLLRSDIPRIAELIRSSFQVITEDDKTETQPIASFGYLSVHFIVKVKDQFRGPRYDGLHDLPFEIQVRTAAMDSWATVSHYLDYKTAQDVPADLRKDFQALSALFYLADTHFEMFYKARQQSKEASSKLFAEAPAVASAQPLNFDSLQALLARRYPGREPPNARAVSDLLTELVHAGYKTVAKLEMMLDRTKVAFALYEKEHPPDTHPEFNPVGVVRGSLRIGDREFRKTNSKTPARDALYERFMDDVPEP